MEQKFSNNSLDLETLREFCKREGEAVTYRKNSNRNRVISAVWAKPSNPSSFPKALTGN